MAVSRLVKTSLYSTPAPPDLCPPPIVSLPDGDNTPIDLEPKHGPLHNHAILALTVLGCIFAVSLMSTFILIFYYRRLKRRRALAALLDTPLFPTDTDNPAAGGGTGPGGGGDDGDDPIHHVWYIRTVGLDEATIESIAVTQYKAGSGLLGSADCSVCLGDFQDGDLVRLLPKCGHAFHVPCIDTWLRAHVNCPVCRSDVVDPTVAASDGDYASATSEASAGDTEEAASEARDGGEVRLEVQSGGAEENENEDEVFEDIPLSDSSSDSAVSTLQADLEQRERRRRTEAVRHRSASVDSPFMIMIPSVVITVPEIRDEQTQTQTQSGKEKERASTGSKVGSTQMGRFEMARSFSSSSGNGSGRSFFFSRSGRSRSTVLPL